MGCEAGMRIWVQPLGADQTKKRPKFGTVSDNLTLLSWIFPERIKISKIGKLDNQLQSLPHLAKNWCTLVHFGQTLKSSTHTGTGRQAAFTLGSAQNFYFLLLFTTFLHMVLTVFLVGKTCCISLQRFFLGTQPNLHIWFISDTWLCI